MNPCNPLQPIIGGDRFRSSRIVLPHARLLMLSSRSHAGEACPG
ncbi:hypothetical protein ACX1C1_10195 [Paenibacillus sp. strain BS8-2]